MPARTKSNRKKPACSRRQFLAAGATAGILAGLDAAAAGEPPASRQASGVKVGEVTESSAIIWARLTAQPTRNNEGRKVVGRPKKEDKLPKITDVAELEGACPGAAGRVQVRYGRDLADAKSTKWASVLEKSDFAHQFSIQGLPPDTLIHYAIETQGPAREGETHAPLTGSFRTAPAADAEAEVTFAVVTCQMYSQLDHADGFHIYPAIAKLDPRFVAFTGDNVYYDSELPIARSPALARYHWQRMYSLPRHIDLLRRVASYWEKDDHDTVKDDSWPGQRAGDLGYPDGQRIFREQVPLAETIYRTFRWGKFLQIWLTDGRDFRSPNTDKDGPAKTIWGKEQKAWLLRCVRSKPATPPGKC
jgi:alkaline phosphatase D